MAHEGSTPASRALAELLCANGRHSLHIEYGGFLSNHMQHGIIALHRLGATSDQLLAFTKAYRQHTVLGHRPEPPHLHDDHDVTAVPPAAPDTDVVNVIDVHVDVAASLAPWLGRRGNFLGLARYFDGEIARLGGAQQALELYLPHLLGGSFGAAMHPVIHMAMGLVSQVPEVVADGLAYSAHSCTHALSLPDARWNGAVPHESNAAAAASPSPVLTPEVVVDLLHSARESGDFLGLIEEYITAPKYR